MNGKDAATETSVVTIHGAKLCIVGVEPDASAARAVDSASKGIPIVLLTHSPDSDVVLKDDTCGVDLICCGHTHGGQIAIPGYGALLSQAKTQRRFVTGLHKIQNTWIYTNRGIGMEGHFPRVRFCAKPELTIYELVPSGHPHQIATLFSLSTKVDTTLELNEISTLVPAAFSPFRYGSFLSYCAGQSLSNIASDKGSDKYSRNAMYCFRYQQWFSGLTL